MLRRCWEAGWVSHGARQGRSKMAAQQLLRGQFGFDKTLGEMPRGEGLEKFTMKNVSTSGSFLHIILSW